MFFIRVGIQNLKWFILLIWFKFNTSISGLYSRRCTLTLESNYAADLLLRISFCYIIMHCKISIIVETSRACQRDVYVLYNSLRISFKFLHCKSKSHLLCFIHTRHLMPYDCRYRNPFDFISVRSHSEIIATFRRELKKNYHSFASDGEKRNFYLKYIML